MASLSNSRNPMAVTAPTGGISANTFKLISGILFFCPEAIAVSETGPGYWKDKLVKGAPKTTGATWTPGQKLYWDTSTGKFVTTATGRTLRAFAAAAAASDDATGDVEICQIAE